MFWTIFNIYEINFFNEARNWPSYILDLNRTWMIFFSLIYYQIWFSLYLTKKKIIRVLLKVRNFIFRTFEKTFHIFNYPEQVVLNSQPCLTFRDKESKRKKWNHWFKRELKMLISNFNFVFCFVLLTFSTSRANLMFDADGNLLDDGLAGK